MLEPHLDMRAPQGEGVWALKKGVRRSLESALGAGQLIIEPAEMGEMLRDASPVKPVTPAAIACPSSIEALSQVLAIANREGIPITPRGGGSGKVGGAIPLYGGILLATHLLPKVIEVDPSSRILKAGVGATLDEVKAAAEGHGLFYPPDPGAGWASIGGTIATNAGGPSAMKYGVTAQSLLGLRVALASGEILHLGRRSPKGVVGLDLVSLFAGSEGTLGVILDATLSLRHRPEAQRALFAPFSSPSRAMDALHALMASSIEPRAAEFFDSHALRALSLSTEGLLPEAGAGLLFAFDGPEEGLDATLDKACGLLRGFASAGVIAESQKVESGALWEARRGLSRAVKAGWRHYISEDVGLPRGQLGAFVTFLEGLRGETGLHILSYGHAGDGNLHVNILFQDTSEWPKVDAATLRIFQEVINLGGTLSGEHGVGAAKRPYIHLELGTPARGLMAQVKRGFDPVGIMNPGKGY